MLTVWSTTQDASLSPPLLHPHSLLTPPKYFSPQSPERNSPVNLMTPLPPGCLWSQANLSHSHVKAVIQEAHTHLLSRHLQTATVSSCDRQLTQAPGTPVLHLLVLSATRLVDTPRQCSSPHLWPPGRLLQHPSREQRTFSLLENLTVFSNTAVFRKLSWFISSGWQTSFTEHCLFCTFFNLFTFIYLNLFIYLNFYDLNTLVYIYWYCIIFNRSSTVKKKCWWFFSSACKCQWMQQVSSIDALLPSSGLLVYPLVSRREALSWLLGRS